MSSATMPSPSSWPTRHAGSSAPPSSAISRSRRSPTRRWSPTSTTPSSVVSANSSGRWFPDHGVIGEEYPPTRRESAFQWILDPIDGTEEFVHGVPTFGTMLALHHRGVPLVGVIDDPALDIRVHAGWAWARTGTAVRSV